MPARSEAQKRLLYAIAAGKKIKGVEMTPEQAQEWLHATPKGNLPEHVKKHKK